MDCNNCTEADDCGCCDLCEHLKVGPTEEPCRTCLDEVTTADACRFTKVVP